MTRTYLTLFCLALLSAPSLVAQSRGAAADPISGTWVGEVAPAEAPRPMAVTMELKFDGKSAVTGTVSGLPNPADVKSGTFTPKTGDLVLRLGRTSDPKVLLTLEGTVVKGTVTGRVTGDGGDKGEFTIEKKK
jgi:hypothetical protein